MGECARSRLRLRETAMPMVRAIGTGIPVVFQRDERAGR
jgi:hypothetical protein